MVYGETGWLPLYVIHVIYTRMVSYWEKLFTGPENKIVYTLYKYLLSQYNNEIFQEPMDRMCSQYSQRLLIP